MSINDNPESAAIVNAITRLGDSLDLPITAEGIEDAAIEERLRALGCSQGTGLSLRPPTSIANTRRLLAERRLLRQPDAPSTRSRKTAPTSQRLARLRSCLLRRVSTAARARRCATGNRPNRAITSACSRAYRRFSGVAELRRNRLRLSACDLASSACISGM